MKIIDFFVTDAFLVDYGVLCPDLSKYAHLNIKIKSIFDVFEISSDGIIEISDVTSKTIILI